MIVRIIVRKTKKGDSPTTKDRIAISSRYACWNAFLHEHLHEHTAIVIGTQKLRKFVAKPRLFDFSRFFSILAAITCYHFFHFLAHRMSTSTTNDAQSPRTQTTHSATNGNGNAADKHNKHNEHNKSNKNDKGNKNTKNKSSDDQLGKPLDTSLLKRLLEFLAPHKKLVIVTLALTILVAAVGPLRPYIIREAIDNYVAHGDTSGLTWAIFQIFALLVVQGVVQYSLTMLMQWIGQNTILDVRTRLFTRLQELSLRYYDTTPVGRLVTRVTNDVEVLNEVFSSGLVMMISSIFVIFWIVIFMFKTSWELALATIVVVPILMIGTNIFRKAVRVQYQEIRTQVARMNAFMNEYITGMNIIQLFSQEDRQRDTFDAINQAHTDAQVRSVFYYAVFFPFIEMMGTLSLSIVIWYAAGRVLEGTMTVGMIVAFSMYGEMFFRPLRELSDKYNTLQSAMASSERIFQLLDEESIVRDNPNAAPMQRFEHSIEFRNVDFAYDASPTNLILRSVNFSVEKGKTVAIVGATGAGKSSLMNLLCRFYEFQGGDILVDGRSIRDIQQRSLRRRVAIVLQDVFLFARTIGENITLGNEEISRETMVAAAEAVGAHEFIAQLPEQYATPVTERGSTLSVGQKQLISFARALATDPDLLILDEATSSVDTATEQQIEHAIGTMLAGRTAIVIAHRLSTIQRADKIIVLHNGKVYEQGSHQELLESNGLYAKLYRLQYKEQLVA
jgi:ATP-binding cassette, subfamily B, multidrug efflux pump